MTATGSGLRPARVQRDKPGHNGVRFPCRWETVTGSVPRGGSRLPCAAVISAFADVSLWQLALVAGVALFASVLGGVAGYGTGALMPLVLVPMVGPEPVVPILAIAALLTNSARTIAFLRHVDWRRAMLVLAGATLPCLVSAYGYTLLTGRGAQFIIGAMLMLTVPLRYALRRRAVVLSDRGLVATSAGYGAAVGGTVGAGVILLSLLMAAGLEGSAVIATDAVLSIAIGFARLLVFGLAGVVTPSVIAFALLIGLVAFPGAFLARAFVAHLPIHVHTAILDAVVLFGGAVMVYGALTRQA
jgi:uncharacterized membrane protein YfcA